MQRAISVAIGVILGSLVPCGCSSNNAADVSPTVAVQVAMVNVTSIDNIVIADAVLYPRDQAAITPKVSAPVAKFYVDRGSRVRAGQLLAELEDRDLQGALTENQGGYAQAEATYQATIQKAEQDQKLAKEQLDAQQRVYDNRKNLFNEGAVSAKDVDEATIGLTQARDQYELAQKQYDLKSAEGGLTSARGKSASAAAQLSYTRIVSPIDGIVTDRPVHVGETAPGGSPILTVMDLSQAIARAHVSQEKIGLMKTGDSATISVVGEADQIPAKVTLVSPALDPNSTTVEVWVQASNPGGRLKAGTSVRVTIVTSTVPHAIVAPADALLTASDGSQSVILLDANKRPHKQRVKVGIRNGDHFQITQGLKSGDTVVTIGAFELDNEDEDVLARTKLQIQAPPGPENDETAP